MSEIQSIATNNFILHNIDAKKLYVQEPLFTANSGDAVYVGWRPDETVLWEGAPTASTNTITVSENFSAFEKIDIYWRSYERRYVTTIFAESDTALPIAVGNVFVLTNGNYEKSMTLWNTSNGTTYTWASTIHGSFTDTQSNSWNSAVVPLKIVGVNRKENA